MSIIQKNGFAQKVSLSMTTDTLKSYPNRQFSISEIVAINTGVVLAIRGLTPVDIAKASGLKMKDIEDLLEPSRKKAKIETVFSVARILKVSPETLLGFESGRISARAN